MPSIRKWYQNQAKLNIDQNRDAGYLNKVTKTINIKIKTVTNKKN